MEKQKMYARISRMFIDDHEVILVTASTVKDCLGNSDLCEYVYTGLFSESSVDEMLISVGANELYIDNVTLGRFTNEFTQKYNHIIRVNQI